VSPSVPELRITSWMYLASDPRGTPVRVRLPAIWSAMDAATSCSDRVSAQPRDAALVAAFAVADSRRAVSFVAGVERDAGDDATGAGDGEEADEHAGASGGGTGIPVEAVAGALRRVPGLPVVMAQAKAGSMP